MRSLLLALAALLALAPACEVNDAPSDPLEDLADNECGAAARCLIEECAGGPSSLCEELCTPAPCGAEALCGTTGVGGTCDPACVDMVQALDEAADLVHDRCRDGAVDERGEPYTAADCEEAVAGCDDIADPAAP